MSEATGKELILDCDPGCDDALGIMLAVRSGTYRKITITTTAGNVSVARTTYNAKKVALIACMGLENPPKIKIYRGSSASLTGMVPNIMSVHGRDGMGDVPQSIYPSQIDINDIEIDSQSSAVDFLRSLADESEKNKYDLICTGPLTNLASALNLSPSPKKLLEKFNRVVIMGGALAMNGNITPTAEFNFFSDPVAVKVVFDYWKRSNLVENKKIHLVPLDITERVQLHEKQFKIKQESPVGMWLQLMLQKYFRFHALSAQALENECADGRCNHQSIRECVYRKLESDLIRVGENGGCNRNGGVRLTKFCYLHDPLAVYLAINYESWRDKLDKVYIDIHVNDDEMRGSLYLTNQKNATMSSVRKMTYTGGIEIRYLSPNKVIPCDIKQFRDKLLSACDWDLKSPAVVLQSESHKPLS